MSKRDEYMDLKQLCDYCPALSERFLRDLIQKIGFRSSPKGKWIIRRSDFDAYWNQQRSRNDAETQEAIRILGEALAKTK